MKYSYLWLKELSKTRKTPAQLAELLARHAFEFEGSKTEGGETQLEFSILPNRGHDALSHIGLAREICACEGRKFIRRDECGKIEYEMPVKSDDRTVLQSLEVAVKDRKNCPRYIGAVIEGVKVAPSPKWLADRLLVSGVKPINNIVDITNYVMLETGQPLHAFDRESISEGSTFGSRRLNLRIIVRKAKEGEKIKLLDEKVYELTEDDLVIANQKKPIALAGVMGGYDSSITNKTTSIILESANFKAASIRKTRLRHNISTESSYRFEREIDPNLAEAGAARAIELLKKYGGEDVKVVANRDIYSQRVNPWQVKLDINYLNRLLGEKIPAVKIKNILINLGMKVKSLGNSVSKLSVEVPTFRIDLETQEDLIEEIGRIYGYENIKKQPLQVEIKAPSLNKKRDFENELRDILTGLGFSEVMNYSFYSADDIVKCNLRFEDHIEVSNPLSLDQQYLRWSLTPNILKNVSLNLKNFSHFQIFEIGKVFFNESKNPKEVDYLAGALVGNLRGDNLFYEFKGRAEVLLGKLGYKNNKYQTLNTSCNFWHPTRAATIIINGKESGRLGEINPGILKKYGIRQRVAVLELELPALIKIDLPEKKYQSISKFPVVERDVSMFVEKDTKYNEIETKINKVGGNLVKNIELFDVFEKDGRTSLALRLRIGSDAKTLTSGEIDNVMKNIISALEKDLKVKVRK